MDGTISESSADQPLVDYVTVDDESRNAWTNIVWYLTNEPPMGDLEF